MWKPVNGVLRGCKANAYELTIGSDADFVTKAVLYRSPKNIGNFILEVVVISTSDPDNFGGEILMKEFPPLPSNDIVDLFDEAKKFIEIFFKMLVK